MQLQNNYHECKIKVLGIVNGSLRSYLYAYCKTIDVPQALEPYYLRKAITFTRLKKGRTQYYKQHTAIDQALDAYKREYTSIQYYYTR